MGYYTSYALVLLDGEGKPIPRYEGAREEMAAKIRALAQDEDFDGETFDGEDGDLYAFLGEPCSYYAKWYEWENDLTAFSKLFPDYVFEVEADGEDSNDFQVAWFKDGKTYSWSPDFTAPPFDPSKLA